MFHLMHQTLRLTMGAWGCVFLLAIIVSPLPAFAEDAQTQTTVAPTEAEAEQAEAPDGVTDSTAAITADSPVEASADAAPDDAAANEDDASTQDSFGKSHAYVMFGEPKYDADFEHFDYVDPTAPKGGRINLGYFLPFDTVHAFALKGTKAPGLQSTDHTFKQRVYDIMLDSLMVPSLDEPQTLYGLIAESVEVAKDFSWVEFTLNPNARWHDGTPITVEDVLFTFDILVEKGDPIYKVYLGQVKEVEPTGERSVRFHFTVKNLRKLPAIVATIPISSKAYWTQSGHDFEKSTLQPPLGNGPYKITHVEQGRSIQYERVDDYWAADHPVNVGQNNFDIVHFQAFRDPTVALEGIKSGYYDLREENSSRNWATAYDTPAIARGDLIKRFIPHKLPTGNQSFIIQLDRYPDRRVREAIGLAYDFDWINHAIMYDAYERNTSFFENSQFAADGPPSEAEIALLEPFRDQLPPEVFEKDFMPPSTGGDPMKLRQNLIKAQQLLKEAGYELNEDGIREHTETGDTLHVEFLYYAAGFNRLFLPMMNNLKKLGITSSIKIVEIAQHQLLLDNKDFLVGIWWFNNGVFFPSIEQRNFFHCDTAEVTGSLNFGKICDPAVDAMIEKIEQASSLEELKSAAHALDRVLLWQHYTIPQYHVKGFRLVHWDKFHKPETPATYDMGVSTWWMKNPDDIPDAVQTNAPQPAENGNPEGEDN